VSELRPSIVIVAGPNGAGKSTVAPALLHGALAVDEFVNADVIARGVSAFDPESAAIAAGRVMLARLYELAEQRVTFAFETTLASRTFAPWLRDLAVSGYAVHLVFLWLSSADLAVERVADRVRRGGRNVPAATVRRLTPQGIRPDSGDGSLGGFTVNFWIPQFGALVRIRLDGMELNAPTFNVDVDQLEGAFLALDSSLHDAQKDLGYSNYVVTVGIHGRVEGIESKEFLARFTGNVPPGLGDVVGSGAVFYFEGRPPATLLSLSADLSAVVTGGVFLKVHSVFDGSMKPELLRKSAAQHLEESLKALGLEVVGK
jgi:predicted ABC-type ATPase